MKQKITKPEDLQIHDGIEVVDSKGDQIKINGEPVQSVLGTRPIRLSRSRPIQAVNMYLPPGVSQFYVERLNKNEIRFLIRTEEVERLADKAEKIMEGKKNDTPTKVEATA